MSVYQILNEVRNEPSKNGKIAILEKHKDNKCLMRAFKYAYDSQKSYYVTSAQIETIPDFFDGVADLGITGFSLLDDLNERLYTGHAAVDKITQTAKALNREDRLVFLDILDRDLKCGATDTTANKVWPGLIFEYEVMLCKDSDEKNKKKIKFPAYVQSKADGGRVNFWIRRKMGGFDIQAFSRNGKPADCLNVELREELAHLCQNLCENSSDDIAFVVDGELLTRGEDGYTIDDRQTGNGIFTKAIRGTIIDQERNKFIAKIWDVTTVEEFEAGYSATPYKDRLAKLQQAIKNVSWEAYPRLHLLDTIMVKDWNDVKALYDKAIENGEEGVIVKNIDAPWEAKRSVNCIKFKECLTKEVKIIGREEGEGKNLGKLGAFLTRDKTGTIITSVGGGFSDAQRLEYNTDDMIGRIIEIECNGIVTKKNSELRAYYQPVFVKIREDKNEPD